MGNFGDLIFPRASSFSAELNNWRRSASSLNNKQLLKLLKWKHTENFAHPWRLMKYRILTLKTSRSVWGAKLWTIFVGNLQTQEKCQTVFAAAAFNWLLFFADSPVIEEPVLELFAARYEDWAYCKHQGAFQTKVLPCAESHGAEMVLRWQRKRWWRKLVTRLQPKSVQEKTVEPLCWIWKKCLWLGFCQSLPRNGW